jgi:tight adherence protein B
MSTLLACALAAAAALAFLPGASPHAVGDRLGPAFGRGVGQAATPSTALAYLFGGRLLQPVAVGALAAGVLHLAAGRPHVIVLGLTGVLAAWITTTLLRRSRARRTRLRRRGKVVSMCDALVAELQSGQPPASAVSAVAREWPELETVRDAARLGGDGPEALRRLSTRPGGEPLAQVAAAWEVASSSGAGLAEVLDRLSVVLRADEEVRREVAASLASPRATATMLAVLPLFGIGLGTAIGAEPLAVLTGSLLGAGCLAAGCVLAGVGLLWVERIVDRAEV